MAQANDIGFLHEFDLGNRDLENPGQNILSVTSQAAGDFEPSNMFEDSTRKVWRSVDVLEQQIVIQADISSQIDTFGILGTNLTLAAIVIVEANVDNNFVAPPFTKIVPVPQRPKNRRNLIIAEDFGSEFEFYRIRILDPTNPCGFIEVGRVVGGRSLIVGGNESITDAVQLQSVDRSKKMQTEGFFRQSNELVVTQNLNITFSKLESFDPQNNQNFEGLRDLFDNVKTTKPFLTVVDRAAPSFINIWGQLSQVPSISFEILKRASFPLRIEEVL